MGDFKALSDEVTEAFNAHDEAAHPRLLRRRRERSRRPAA